MTQDPKDGLAEVLNFDIGDLGDFDADDIADEVSALEKELDGERGTTELTVEDLGAYDVLDVNVGEKGFARAFVRPFLLGTREAYESTGRGDFEIILRWSHNRVNDEDVNRYIHAVRANISALRKTVPHEKGDFVFTKLEYEILADKRHVLLCTCRCRPDQYAELQKQRMVNRLTTNSNADLAKLM